MTCGIFQIFHRGEYVQVTCLAKHCGNKMDMFHNLWHPDRGLTHLLRHLMLFPLICHMYVFVLFYLEEKKNFVFQSMKQFNQ